MADEPFALADRVAACLLSLTPSAVHRANRRLTQSHNFLTYEDDLRTLLEFHQDVVSPISSTFAYALPSSKALRAIVKHAPSSIIEIGAGGGLWASLLRRCGVVETCGVCVGECVCVCVCVRVCGIGRCEPMRSRR